MDADCVAFETDYKGRLAEGVARDDGGVWLAEAVRRYEAIDDLAGRLGSYAGLVHAGDSVDPVISKFYGDVSERLTAASLHLLFFALELNRIDDAVIERAMQTPLAHYRPWIEDLRKDKPYQLEDRVEQLFHEKSQSGYAAWNRLFDQTISGLRFKVGARSWRSSRRSTCCRTARGKAQGRGRRWQRPSRTMSGPLRSSPTRSPRTRRFPIAGAASRMWRISPPEQPRRARGRRCPGRLGSRGLSAAVAPLLQSEGRLVQKKKLAHWDRNAPLPFAATGVGWPEAQKMVLTAYRGFSVEMAAIAERFFTDRWIDAPVRPGKAPGAFSHRPRPRRIPMC